MKQRLSTILSIIAFLLVINAGIAYAASQGINATVKNSICGNNLKESGEECDNSDLNNMSCEKLGFSGGNLSCNIACGFNTASCETPSIDQTNVQENEVDSLVAAGYLSVPTSEQITETTSVSTNSKIYINLADGSGVSLPANTKIERSDGETFDPTKDFSVQTVSKSSVSGLVGGDVLSSIQWGIAGTELVFDNNITIKLSVGNLYSGETLNIYRSENLTSGWTTSGLIDTTCLVDVLGNCSFRSQKASYYVAALPANTASAASPTPNSSSSTQSSSTGNSGISSSSQNTPESMPVPVFRLPSSLLAFDIRNAGHLYPQDLRTMIQIWIDSWKNAINNSSITNLSTRCDINRDGYCGINDFSVLMYYIGR